MGGHKRFSGQYIQLLQIKNDFIVKVVEEWQDVIVQVRNQAQKLIIRNTVNRKQLEVDHIHDDELQMMIVIGK